MSVSIHKIKKWLNMVLGNSVYHVNQGPGARYSATCVSGYYNDLTEKITRFGCKDNLIPLTTVDSGEVLEFCIAIFQYGLAAYDIYISSKDSDAKEKLINCAEWAVANQEFNGFWKAFEFEDESAPYSSMAQGEAISMLLRAYIVDPKQTYLACTHKAYKALIKNIADGGVAQINEKGVWLYEYQNSPLILNGWIFSYWGLRDYALFFNDSEAKKKMLLCEKTLASSLSKFDRGYWSNYDEGGRICSPFYHSLHIAQLHVMYALTGIEEFRLYERKWRLQEERAVNKAAAFLLKTIQKITE